MLSYGYCCGKLRRKWCERFKEVINNVFKDIAENGVDEYKLRGVINSIKFYFKEEEFGYKPRGLFLWVINY